MNQRRLHMILTIVWAAAVVPTVVWWSESVLWVALISCYANMVGHWGAYEAARMEQIEQTRGGTTDGGAAGTQ